MAIELASDLYNLYRDSTKPLGAFASPSVPKYEDLPTVELRAWQTLFTKLCQSTFSSFPEEYGLGKAVQRTAKLMGKERRMVVKRMELTDENKVQVLLETIEPMTGD